MLKIKVKANAITNLTDARYFAAREVDWLGFCFDETSESHITPQAMFAMKEWVDGVKFIGEFRDTKVANILDHVEKLGLDAVQVDELIGIDVLIELSDVLIFKEINITADSDRDFVANLMEQFAPYCAHFIFIIENEMPDWIEEYSENYSVWIDGNIPIEQVIDSTFQGICLKGGVEEKVGFKSFDELDEILDLLEIS